MAKIEGFCIDRWEAHLQLQTSPGSFKDWSPYAHPGGQVVRAVSAPGAVPQAYLSGTEAAAACKLAGKRLCKDSEWLRACRGPANWSYPYGAALALGKCNDHRSVHPAVELYGTSASWIYSKLDNACLNQLPNSLAVTGSYPGCVSAEGVWDLVGNLHEWTADPAGTFRGGFYVDTKLNGPGCLYATTAHDSSHWDYSTGFRCCADPL
jgi:formylglycine-generating enzyme required for sulfatase activity